MQEHLIDAVMARHRRPEETEDAFMQRLRKADGALTPIYKTTHVDAREAYADPMRRAAYMLRYFPHYVLQLGDLLKALEGDPAVAALLCRPQLRHGALCGGAAPEALALGVLHAQAGGQRLHTTVLDRQEEDWSDCWPISASTARAFGQHPQVEIDGQHTDLSCEPSPEERAVLADCQVLTLMNALNELMLQGAAPLMANLEARLDALPPGAMVLMTDQGNYTACQRGLQLLQTLLERRGGRLLVANTSAQQIQSDQNRFRLSSRLRSVYNQSASDGGAKTRNYRIHNHQLQLAAVMPD